jgi:hypothetical protein
MKISLPRLLGRRRKASTGKRETDRLVVNVPDCEVRRNADGSIDIAFYRERARRLRREANLELCRSIREFSRAWF